MAVLMTIMTTVTRGKHNCRGTGVNNDDNGSLLATSLGKKRQWKSKPLVKLPMPVRHSLVLFGLRRIYFFS